MIIPLSYNLVIWISTLTWKPKISGSIVYFLCGNVYHFCHETVCTLETSESLYYSAARVWVFIHDICLVVYQCKSSEIARKKRWLSVLHVSHSHLPFKKFTIFGSASKCFKNSWPLYVICCKKLFSVEKGGGDGFIYYYYYHALGALNISFY